MAIEQRRSRPRALFAWAVLGMACATLDDADVHTTGSIRTTGDGMAEAVRRWRDQATPEERAVIDELMARKDLQIHVVLVVGRLSKASRGGESMLASNSESGRLCIWHPKAQGVPPGRDWEVFYDPERAKEYEEKYGIPTPVEVVLQHEIFGHIVLLLKKPQPLQEGKIDKKFLDTSERQALDVENRYRQRFGLQEVPPELEGFSPP